MGKIICVPAFLAFKCKSKRIQGKNASRRMPPTLATLLSYALVGTVNPTAEDAVFFRRRGQVTVFSGCPSPGEIHQNYLLNYL